MGVNVRFPPIADIAMQRQTSGMKQVAIGLTAPSTTYPGATISVECNRILDGEKLTESLWVMNVFGEDGGWIASPDSDVLEYTTEEFISRLNTFYDGTSLWTVDGTDEKLTFWQMLVRTLPENISS